MCFFQSYTSNFSSKYWCDINYVTPFKLEICGCLAKAHCFLLYLENKNLENRRAIHSTSIIPWVWVKARESRFLIQFHQWKEPFFPGMATLESPEIWRVSSCFLTNQTSPSFLQLAIFLPQPQLAFFPNFSKNWSKSEFRGVSKTKHP